jgi:hypothetical protein
MVRGPADVAFRPEADLAVISTMGRVGPLDGHWLVSNRTSRIWVRLFLWGPEPF